MLRFRASSLALIFTLHVATLCVHGQEPGKNQGREFAKAVRPYVDRQELAGAVLLAASKEKVLQVEAVGWADAVAKKPMKTDAMFWIASMTKAVTGAGLMILVDEGKVDLDAPVAKYLPEFKDVWVAVEKEDDHLLLKRPKRPMTVRDAMAHTSGLPFKSELEQPTLDGLPLKDAMLGYVMTPLDAEPGAEFIYSNCGINIGGRIIEVVTGKPYESFMQERLFDPLAMKDATFWPNEEQLSRLAVCHAPRAKGKGLEIFDASFLRRPYSDRKNRFAMPGGGLFATAADVASFCRMVLRGGELDGKRILSETAVKTMTSKQTPKGMPIGYGVGWATFGPEKSFGHGGAWHTDMTIHAKEGLATVYMVQHAEFAGEGEDSLDAFKEAALARFGGRP